MSLSPLPAGSGAGGIVPTSEVPPRGSLGLSQVGPWGPGLRGHDLARCTHLRTSPALARSVSVENPPRLELVFLSVVSRSGRMSFQEEANKLSGLHGFNNPVPVYILAHGRSSQQTGRGSGKGLVQTGGVGPPCEN